MSADSRIRKQTLDAVFSLLPKSNADSAIRHIVDLAREPKSLEAFEIRWAEFDLSGRFLRGGLSDISDLSTIVFASSQSDFGVNMLARRAAEPDLKPGLMDWSPDHRWLLWYVPFRHMTDNGKTTTRLRGLLIGADLFGEMLELFNQEASLTSAEKRTVFQLVGGLELRDAARIDGVGYETKRAQIKSAGDKLGCNGQKELIRTVLGQLFHLMSISDSELRTVEPAVQFAEKYLADDMQFAVIRDGSGETLRYLVGGPASGKPVVLVHGMMFPVILRGIAAFLERHDIRLYVPIRPGYLESRALGALFEHENLIQHGVGKLAAFIQEKSLAPVTLVGNSLGAAAACEMCRQNPALVSRLVLLSPNLAPSANEDHQANSTFYQGMHELKSDALLFKLVNLEYRRFYSDPATCRHILDTHFASSGTDVKVLAGHYTGHPVYEMFASAYPSSIVGIAEDFRSVMTKGRFDVRKLGVPVHIIRGEEDPLTSAQEIAGAFGMPVGDMTIVGDGAGHFAAVSHGAECWAMIADICAAREREHAN